MKFELETFTSLGKLLRDFVILSNIQVILSKTKQGPGKFFCPGPSFFLSDWYLLSGHFTESISINRLSYKTLSWYIYIVSKISLSSLYSCLTDSFTPCFGFIYVPTYLYAGTVTSRVWEQAPCDAASFIFLSLGRYLPQVLKTAKSKWMHACSGAPCYVCPASNFLPKSRPGIIVQLHELP